MWEQIAAEVSKFPSMLSRSNTYNVENIVLKICVSVYSHWS